LYQGIKRSFCDSDLLNNSYPVTGVPQLTIDSILLKIHLHVDQLQSSTHAPFKRSSVIFRHTEYPESHCLSSSQFYFYHPQVLQTSKNHRRDMYLTPVAAPVSHASLLIFLLEAFARPRQLFHPLLVKSLRCQFSINDFCLFPFCFVPPDFFSYRHTSSGTRNL